MRPLTFIVNPAAGSGHTLEVEKQLRAALTEKQITADFIHSRSQGHAAELARQAAGDGVPTVVAVGGDGTNLEVATGLVGSSAALGIIPAGTGNDLIKTLGIPGQPLEALEHLLSHPARPMDAGFLNGRPFLNVCGTGFDVRVLDNTERYKKRFRGKAAYLLGLIDTVKDNTPIEADIETDTGERIHRKLLLCSIANGRFIGGGIPICPAAKPDDGLLDLVVVDAVSRMKVVRCLPALMQAKVLDLDITTHLLVRSLRLRVPNMRIQIDGEITPMEEADFELKPGALLVHW